jgi:hypothetical protein
MSVKEEVRGCLIALEALLSEIEEIMGLIADKKQLLGAKKKHAQEKLKIFKQKLEYEYWRISTRRGKGSLNEIEKKYYAPVVRQLSANLHIRSNSIPGSRWQAELGDLLSKSSVHIDQLRKQLEH